MSKLLAIKSDGEANDKRVELIKTHVDVIAANMKNEIPENTALLASVIFTMLADLQLRVEMLEGMSLLNYEVYNEQKN